MNRELLPLTEKERRKYEIAEELGLTGKLIAHGWAGLSPEESGRIGGLMAQRAARERAAGKR